MTDKNENSTKEREYTWDEYLGILVKGYANHKDGTLITIGHWEMETDALLGDKPKFCPYMQMTVGELKKLKAQADA